jgi:carboxypeptidase family protein
MKVPLRVVAAIMWSTVLMVGCDKYLAITGRVTDGAGAALDGVQITLTRPSGGVPAQETSSSDGAFRIGGTYGFGSGPRLLSAAKPGFRELRIEVEPAPNYSCESTLRTDAEARESTASCITVVAKP